MPDTFCSTDPRPVSANRTAPAFAFVPGLALAGALALPTSASAHPGEHAPGITSLWHALTQPDHVAGMALLLVLVGLVARHLLVRRGRRDRAPGQRR